MYMWIHKSACNVWFIAGSDRVKQGLGSSTFIRTAIDIQAPSEEHN